MNNKIKCVVWDLDETLWSGTLLENEEVKLKPSIKHILFELDKRGILQSIASKNDRQKVMDKLKLFKIDHLFLYTEINWNPKSKSINNISENLNINKESILFIDDQAFEREEVKMAFPNVKLLASEKYLELLTDPRLIPNFITDDGKRRREMYVEESMRNIEESKYEGTPEEFLKSLDMNFVISEAKEDDLKRAEELTVRTNQLNATGKTYDYEELNNFRKSKNHLLLVCDLEDRFGSYGKIGLALIEKEDDYWTIKLLLMSCRVMSRGVGTILLTCILEEAKKNVDKVYAEFKETDRNRMMYITYKFANFVENNSMLENDLSLIQKYPEYVSVKINELN